MKERKALFIIFGATGDLAQRKLYPALFHLYQKGFLKNKFAVIGTARRPWTNERLQEVVRNSVADMENNALEINQFASHFYYQSHNVNEYPALFHLYQKGFLKNKFAVIGTARRPWTNERLQEVVRNSVADMENNALEINQFASHFYYQSHNVNDTEHYITLKNLAAKLDERYQIGGIILKKKIFSGSIIIWERKWPKVFMRSGSLIQFSTCCGTTVTFRIFRSRLAKFSVLKNGLDIMNTLERCGTWFRIIFCNLFLY